MKYSRIQKIYVWQRIGLLLLFILVFSARGYGQDSTSTIANFYQGKVSTEDISKTTAEKLQTIVTLKKGPQNLVSALQSIARQAGFTLSYSEQVIPHQKKVTIKRAKLPAEQVLWDILEGTGYRFGISASGQLVLVRMQQVSAPSQQETITGSVTDAQSGETLPGVNILVKGTSTGTSTNADGAYELTVESLQDTLVFSFIGYQQQSVPINGRTEIDIEMQSQVFTGEEMVVTGYSTQEKQDVTSSIATADVEGMQKISTSNTAQALQGQAAGVHISARNGNPGSDVNLTIRGYSSFNGDNSPLVIIDGVQAQTGLTNLNSNDIQSIQVLKDASAAAIYGSRAANGVILVETKKGKAGSPKFTYNNYVGIQSPYKGIPLTNANEYVSILQRMYGQDLNGAASPPQAALDYISNPDQLQSYNWQGLIYSPASMQMHNLAVSGGGEFGTYRISGEYLDQNGITAGTGYQRANIRANGKFFIGDNITIGQSISLSKSKKLPEQNGFSRSMYQNATQMYPYFPPKTDNGEWRTESFYWGGGTNPESVIRNPLHYLSMRDEWVTQDEIALNMYGQVEFSESFSYKISGSYSQSKNEDKYWFGDKSDLANFYEYYDANKAVGNNYDFGDNWNVDNTLRFNQDFGKQHADITVGFIAQMFKDKGLSGSKDNFLSETTTTLNGPGGQHVSASGYSSTSSLLSFIGQANYSYDERYLLTVNFRRDGSSRFAPDYRWGNFPGVSTGWRISNEKFWEKAGLSSIISDFKIRGGFGTIGRQNVGDYPYSPVLQFIPTVYGEAIYDGIITGTPINQQVSWEQQISKNIGIDYGLFEGQISGSFEYFNNISKDMIIPLAIAPSAGGGELQSNTGRMTNHGFEMTLNYNKSVGDFSYNAGFNLGTTNATLEKIGRELITYGSPEWDVPHAMEMHEGGGLAEFWLIKTAGLFRSQEEIDNYISSGGSVIQPNAKPGDIRYLDANDDGRITDADRQNVGSGIPKVSIGFNFSANFKNFDASLNVTGAFGQVIYNATRYLTSRNYGYENFGKYLLDAYDPQMNPNSNIPRLNPNDVDDNWNSRPTSDRFIENGDYVKVRNLELGYTLPKSLSGRVQMSSARIFIRSQNLYTFTGYSGADPEVGASPILGGTFTQGLDRDTAPQARSFQVGVNLEF